MGKTAVVFPGVGYNKDRPLLYYAGKLAVSSGYELISIDFSGIDWSKDKLKDRSFLLKTLEKCLKITEDRLKNIDSLSDNETVFISKSIGTVVATAYAQKKALKVKQICFSPLEMIDDYVTRGGAVLFCSDNDPYADYTSVKKIAQDKDLEINSISGGNHSLETGDINTDIENLKTMMQRVKEILNG